MTLQDEQMANLLRMRGWKVEPPDLNVEEPTEEQTKKNDPEEILVKIPRCGYGEG